MATGSDIALLCGFRVTQARAARQERQQQEGQTRFANLATLFPDWETFQTASATSNCQKPLRRKLATFFWSPGEGWRRRQDILATKVMWSQVASSHLQRATGAAVSSPPSWSISGGRSHCVPSCSRSTAGQRTNAQARTHKAQSFD